MRARPQPPRPPRPPRRARLAAWPGVVLLSLALLAAACSKDEEKPTAAGAQQEPGGDEPAPAAQAAAADRGTEDVEPALAPDDFDELAEGDDPASGGAADPTPRRPPREAERAEPAGERARRPGGERQERAQPRGMPIDHLLELRAIHQTFAATTELTLSPATFPGQAPDATYNALRLEPLESERFGLGLQVWKPSGRGQAQQRFEQLFSQSVGGVMGREVGDRSFRAEHHSLRTLTFVDQRRSTVVALTCDAALCEFEQMVAFSQTLQQAL